MLDKLTTEARNPATEAIDTKSALEIAYLINDEDARVAAAVRTQVPLIARAIDAVASALRGGGRLIYLGAGTSGRLGVLDASECPPTFRTAPDQVIGLIAGGEAALTRAIEGAEDDTNQAIHDLSALQLHSRDVVIGIATSGSTPYVVRGMRYARELGSRAIGVACNPSSQLDQVSDFCIVPVVGPEVITGSTRMKAGTATKMVLNSITTGAMIRIGKTYGNLMVDLQATNRKLIDRSRRIVCELTGVSSEEAERLLASCGGDLKTAVVAHQAKLSPAAARLRLERAGGHLREALRNEL